MYRKAYSEAFVSAIRAVDPTWTHGNPVPSGVVDGITREAVEANLHQSGNRLLAGFDRKI